MLDQLFFEAVPSRTLAFARQELRKAGVSASLDALCRWRAKRRAIRQKEAFWKLPAVCRAK